MDVEMGLPHPCPPTVMQHPSCGDTASETLGSFDNDQKISPERFPWVSRLKKALFPQPKGHSSTRSVFRQLDRCPQGYPRLATFLDSDENFMIYRRFGFLHARVLLQKQDELRIMERDLDQMDHRDVRNGNAQMLQCRVDDDRRTTQVGTTRGELLCKIEGALLKYDQLLLNAQSLASANRPAIRDYNSVVNFVRNTQPLVEGDSEFIYNREDLVTLRPGRESAWLDLFVEKILKVLPRRPVQYLFCSKEATEKTADPCVRYFTKSRVDRLVSGIILLLVIVLLIIPVYALYHVSSITSSTDSTTISAACIGILLVATLSFSVTLSLVTRARRHEILGAAAAYCATLVVFIGNLGIHGSN